MSPFLIPCSLFTASWSFCNSRSTSSSSSSLPSIGGVRKALGCVVGAATATCGCCCCWSSLGVLLQDKSTEIGRNIDDMERFSLKRRISSCHGSVKRRMFCRVNHCSSSSLSSLDLISSCCCCWWLLLESLKSMANSKRVGCFARMRPQTDSLILSIFDPSNGDFSADEKVLTSRNIIDDNQRQLMRMLTGRSS